MFCFILEWNESSCTNNFNDQSSWFKKVWIQISDRTDTINRSQQGWDTLFLQMQTTLALHDGSFVGFWMLYSLIHAL